MSTNQAQAPRLTAPLRTFRVGWAAALVLGLASAMSPGCGPQPIRADGGPSEAPDEREGEAGRIVKVRGPGGLSSPSLPEGTFLGEGGQLDAGQTVEVPRGVQAELRLTDGQVLRANERSTIQLPGKGGALTLDQGEIVLLLVGTEPLSVHAGDDRLIVHEGEVLVRRDDEGNTVSVVSGRAELRRGDDTVSLGAGSQVTPDGASHEEGGTDGAVGPVAPVARRSLDVLDETRWAASFDAVAEQAELLPRGVGSLTARRAGSKVEHQPLRLVDQKVTVSIDGRLAHTEIEQAFHNDAGAVMEGIYRFPLPSDASISGLSLLVGSRWMEGEMLEKTRARRIFRQIVDATIPRDPALLQWEQGNVFKLNVFPIPARGERRIRLRYTQVLPESGEYLRYRYPMGGSGATGTEIEHFEFQVTVDGHDLSPDQLADVRTPMMALERAPGGSDDRLVLTARKDDFLPTWDLGVDVPLGDASAAAARLDTHLDQDGQAYFMATLRPGELPVPPARPTSYAFVLDRSHGVAPELWSLSRAMVQTVLDRMDAEDQFTLLACDTACDAFAASPRGADPSTKAAALSFIDGQTLAGATDLGSMLRSGARSLDRATGDRDKVVIYLGDGVPTSGALTIDELAMLTRRELGRTRLLSVATGARSDLTVLDHLSRITGGEVLRADPRDDVGALVRELVLRAEVPAARDLELELPPGLVDVHPKVLPALRSGDELTVVGRMTKPVDGQIRLRAADGDGRVVQSFAVEGDARRGGGRNQHLPRTWAQAEIAHLTATRGAEAREVIVAMSRDYNVLSRWTALLVLENDRMYREFGVARKSDDKDGWRGTKGDEAKGEAGTEVYGGAADPSSSAETSSEALEEKTAERQDAAAPSGMPSTAQPGKAKDANDARAWSGPTTTPTPPRPDLSAHIDDDFDAEDEAEGGFVADDIDAANNAQGRASSTDARSGNRRPRPKSSSRPAKKAKRPQDDILGEPWGGDADFGGGGRGGGAYVPSEPRYKSKPRRRLPVSGASEPSERSLARVDELAAEVRRQPTDRKAHERLVKQAIYTGHPQAREFASSWAEVDPDYAPALLAHADLLAATGDPIAPRAYASAAEVRPFSKRQHDWLARAFASKGDWARACSHRQALVSIDPAQASLHRDLAECLDAAGRSSRAKAAVIDGLARAKRPGSLRGLDERLDGEPPQDRLHGSPDVSVTLTWSGDADLDIALVDRRGRRLSPTRPERIRVREQAHEERLTFRKLSGPLHVEVTRADAGEGSVSGELTVRTPTTTRRFPISLTRGTARLARVHETWR